MLCRIARDRGFVEAREELAVGNAAISDLGPLGDRPQVPVAPVVLDARPEHQCV